MLSRVVKQSVKYLFSITKQPSQPPSSNNDKSEITKTYLEMISPKQIHQMIDRSQGSSSELINSLRQIIKKQKNVDAKQIKKKIQKEIQYLELYHVKELIKLNSESKHPLVRQIYKSVVKFYEKNLDYTPMEDLINVVYQMAKCNIKEPHLMKQLECKILDDGVPLKYDLIRKLLYVYSHLNIGTATLYSTITRTIKLGYHELEPYHLAEFAYHLSKVSDNAKGGFGVFKIAEQVTMKNIYRLNFSELVTISKFMISQNIGSNDFQLTLEQQILKKFPLTNQLNINHLKQLLHCTSGYHFKYKDNSLGQRLQNQTMKNMKFTTVEQANIFLWSWARAKRGSRQLWSQMQRYYLQKAQLLNPRNISFNYYSFSKSTHDCNKILDKLQQCFSKLDLNSINKHYLLKFLQGMHQRRTYNTPLFKQVTQILIQYMNKLSPKQFIGFLKILNESDFDYQSKQIDSLISLLKSFQSKIINKLSTMSITDIVEIMYLWTKLNIKDSSEFIKKITQELKQVNSIPKQSFLKALFSLIIKDQYKLAYEMIQILFQLRNYGPIGYFFSPYEYPLLVYSVFTYYVKGRTKLNQRLIVDQQAMDEIKHYFEELEPRSLNHFIEKVYNQTKGLIKEYQENKI